MDTPTRAGITSSTGTAVQFPKMSSSLKDKNQTNYESPSPSVSDSTPLTVGGLEEG